MLPIIAIITRIKGFNKSSNINQRRRSKSISIGRYRYIDEMEEYISKAHPIWRKKKMFRCYVLPFSVVLFNYKYCFRFFLYVCFKCVVVEVWLYFTANGNNISKKTIFYWIRTFGKVREELTIISVSSHLCHTKRKNLSDWSNIEGKRFAFFFLFIDQRTHPSFYLIYD